MSKILLGLVVALIGTKVVAKTLMKSGGGISGLVYLILPSVANVVTFFTKPFWADLEPAKNRVEHTQP